MAIVTAPAAPATAAAPRRSPADLAVRRVLRIPEQRGTASKRAQARKAFSTSILISAVRCVLTYLVLPFVAPALGVAKGVGPWIGLPIGAVAIVFNVLSIRRFWAADHRWRWAYTAIGLTVIGLLLVLMAGDLIELLG
jgi:hypothetical protein